MMNQPTPPAPRGRRQFLKNSALVVGATVLARPSQVLAFANRVIYLRGNVYTGADRPLKPIAKASISLYEATSAAPSLLGTATTTSTGAFTLPTSLLGPESDGIFYVTADVGLGVQLVSVLGPVLPASVVINELTTVAAGYSLAQFVSAGDVSGPEFALQLAAGMNDNLVSPLTGNSSSVLLSPPNGDQTNSLRSTRSLANILALYVRTRGLDVTTFFGLTTPPGGLPPVSFLQALSNLARFPQQNVSDIYDLTQSVQAYAPGLVTPPDTWTIVVKVNNTGSPRYPFGGPANIAFDAKGCAWITNNVVQGTPNSGVFNVVLQPNGQPANGSNGTPKSPLLGGGILGAGFGISIAADGTVWMGNYGWGSDAYIPSADGNGSVSQFSATGVPISPPQGYQGGPVRAQAVVPDADNNIWIASYGNDRIYVFLNGDPSNSIYFQEVENTAPFNIEMARDGTVWVTNSGGLSSDGPSSVARYALVDGQIVQLSIVTPGGDLSGLKGFQLDSFGQAWVASGNGNCICLFDETGALVDQFTGGGISAPWSTAVDGDDHVWVANFGPELAGNDFTQNRISKLAGSNPATRPPGLNAGDPISPPTGYTLPSGGDQVRLSNGLPMYGRGNTPSYSPLLRQTNIAIDQAGNVWAINNWKPSFDFDLANPGGDGICIFVGAAKPPVS
jgi:hypothetical protein